MSSQRRSCSICRSRSLISAMAHPPGAGQSQGHRPLHTAQGSPGKGEDEAKLVSVGSAGGVGNSILELASPPPPHLTSSHSPDRLLKTPVESRGTALKDGGQEAPLTITAAATLARAFGVPAVLFPSALGRRHRRFHFRPRRGSKGRPVPPHDGCGVIHTLPLPRRTLNPTSGA